MFKSAIIAAAAFFGSIVGAQATPIDLTFTGQIAAYNLYDQNQQFGPNTYGQNVNPLNYSITIAYNPTALTGDTCGSSPNNSCNWNFGTGGVSEAITINGITKTFTATSGTIQFCACSTDQIYINANSSGVEFGGSFVDSTSLFSSQTNVNNPNLLTVFNNVALSNSSFQSSTTVGGSVSFDVNPTNLSDTVPEPMTISLFGAGIAAAAAIRRRRNKTRST